MKYKGLGGRESAKKRFPELSLPSSAMASSFPLLKAGRRPDLKTNSQRSTTLQDAAVNTQVSFDLQILRRSVGQGLFSCSDAKILRLCYLQSWHVWEKEINHPYLLSSVPILALKCSHSMKPLGPSKPG